MTEHDDKQMASVDAVANVEPSKERRRFVKAAIIAAPAVMIITKGRLAAAQSGCDGSDPASICLSAGSSLVP